jgi:uncharacterized membrane protein
MNKKIAPLCYLTVLGFLIARLFYARQKESDKVLQFHLRQSFGLYITSFCCYRILRLRNIVPNVTNIPSLIVFFPLIALWLVGLLDAVSGRTKPYPLIGKIYQKWFSFVTLKPGADRN